MHRGRNDAAASANANADVPRKFTANSVVRRNSQANANVFANEMKNNVLAAELPCE